MKCLFCNELLPAENFKRHYGKFCLKEKCTPNEVVSFPLQELISKNVAWMKEDRMAVRHEIENSDINHRQFKFKEFYVALDALSAATCGFPQYRSVFVWRSIFDARVDSRDVSHALLNFDGTLFIKGPVDLPYKVDLHREQVRDHVFDGAVARFIQEAESLQKKHRDSAFDALIDAPIDFVEMFSKILPAWQYDMKQILEDLKIYAATSGRDRLADNLKTLLDLLEGRQPGYSLAKPNSSSQLAVHGNYASQDVARLLTAPKTQEVSHSVEKQLGLLVEKRDLKLQPIFDNIFYLLAHQDRTPQNVLLLGDLLNSSMDVLSNAVSSNEEKNKALDRVAQVLSTLLGEEPSIKDAVYERKISMAKDAVEQIKILFIPPATPTSIFPVSPHRMNGHRKILGIAAASPYSPVSPSLHGMSPLATVMQSHGMSPSLPASPLMLTAVIPPQPLHAFAAGPSEAENIAESNTRILQREFAIQELLANPDAKLSFQERNDLLDEWDQIDRGYKGPKPRGSPMRPAR